MILPLRWDTVEVALPLPMMRITTGFDPPRELSCWLKQNHCRLFLWQEVERE